MFDWLVMLQIYGGNQTQCVLRIDALFVRSQDGTVCMTPNVDLGP